MFGISVSGIKNSQKHIDVTSNNIANANSYGFKKSRAEFADVYANSVYSNNRTNAGMGVQNTVVSQQFVQGALSGDTGNSLDMAIQGNGFFVLSSKGNSAHTYTRNGAFQVDKNGFIITATGDYLQGWNVNSDGSTASLDLGSTHNIKIPADTGAPSASHDIGIGVNLPADKDPVTLPKAPLKDPWGKASADFTEDELKYGISRKADGTVDDPAEFRQYYLDFDPKNSDTYTASTSQTIHDSLGKAHTLTYYMFKMGPEAEGSNNTVWNVIPFVDGKPVDIAAQNGENPIMMSVPDGSTSSIAGSNFFGFQLTFDSSGEPIKQVPSKLELVNAGPNEEAIPGARLGNSLRHSLFGTLGMANDPANIEGSLGAGIFDRTFEDVLDDTDPNKVTKEAHFGGDGSLHTALGTGIDPRQNLQITFNATQYGSSNFGVTEAPWNDGYSTGLLLSVNVDENGIIQCEYSNGQMVNVAKVALADFPNVQGLSKIGDTQWKESLYSGAAIAKEANVGSAGAIKGSNLELSNVDLTSELVELITAQRNYQANAQSLQTNNTVMDSILNIR